MDSEIFEYFDSSKTLNTNEKHGTAVKRKEELCGNQCLCVCLCVSEVNHAGSDPEVSLGQVAPPCHKVRDAKHPPVSRAVPIICTQLSRPKNSCSCLSGFTLSVLIPSVCEGRTERSSTRLILPEKKKKERRKAA